MNQTIIARAESILRDALNGKSTWRRRAEQFLARQPGRPRKAARSEIAALRDRGMTAVEIAVKLGLHPCNIWRALRSTK